MKIEHYEAFDAIYNIIGAKFPNNPLEVYPLESPDRPRGFHIVCDGPPVMIGKRWVRLYSPHAYALPAPLNPLQIFFEDMGPVFDEAEFIEDLQQEWPDEEDTE